MPYTFIFPMFCSAEVTAPVRGTGAVGLFPSQGGACLGFGDFRCRGHLLTILYCRADTQHESNH